MLFMQYQQNQAILSSRCPEPKSGPGPGLSLGIMGVSDPLSVSVIHLDGSS